MVEVVEVVAVVGFVVQPVPFVVEVITVDIRGATYFTDTILSLPRGASDAP